MAKIKGTSKNDKLSGTNNADIIVGKTGNDKINGGKGDDKIFAGSGNDKVNGGKGNDIIFGGSGNDKINGGKGDDKIFGGSGNDKIHGGSGNDKIFGGSGNDKIHGGSGNDTLIGGAGADTLTGGSGNDVFVYRAVSDSALAGWDRINDFTQGQDKIDLSALLGTTDLVWGNQTATANGAWFENSNCSTFVYADTDNDGVADLKVELKNTSGLNLTAGDFIGVSAAPPPPPPPPPPPENSAPVAVADKVLTNVTQGQAVVIPGAALLANDTDADADPLGLGGVANPAAGDLVSIVGGNVHYTDNGAAGGSFDYTASDGVAQSAPANVSVETQVGSTVNGTAANEILVANSVAGTVNTLNGGGGNDYLFGGIGNDILHGGDGDDSLFGGGDSDELYGGAGNDILDGGDGFDVLYGGDGNDIVDGGAGDDFLFGDAGADIFRYDSLSDADTPGIGGIVDFSQAEGDKIDLHYLLNSFAGYDGTNAFTGGYLAVVDGGGFAVVQVDSTGGGDSFQDLTAVYTVPTLAETDFIL